ncbi:mitochondrial membrane protein Pet127 [Podospora appendiculata]|uniref:Mitochondrial membrane protein Pet127 n=1 Tax=Podospora appendiculata TaxID=314037 RepID=A0AAE0X4H7_9PEZI|nr:mitochondrial membrane protein Pet127 [Podospora appendiculata]
MLADIHGPKDWTKKPEKPKPIFTVNVANPAQLKLTPIDRPQPPVPSLTYGLDRVLFNPGVYHLQDPRSRVFNFDPYLARIMPIKQFDFNALKQYVTSSKDEQLIKIATEYKRKYTGSTSSMTAMLAHFHFLISSWRPVNAGATSRDFMPDSNNFTRILRAPAATFLHWKDGTYAIDADKEFDTANILSMLGKSMEKFLTLSKDGFEKYRRTNSDQLSDEERNGPEAFNYTTMGDFMMRSQLDAYDPRIPGSGMFDLKTRAVVSIRMDAKNFHQGLGYEIRSRFGQWESFEREYFDMIRSAFLKYSLQVRMGRMDGIFVAFHNTQRIFGFQYVSLPEMDQAIHGTAAAALGDQEFKLSLHLLNQVLDKATAKFPKQSLRLHFETRPTDPPFMYIFAKPVTPGEIEEVQGASRATIEQFERDMMGMAQDDIAAEDAEIAIEEEMLGESAEEIAEESSREISENTAEESAEIDDFETGSSLDVWEDMMLKVEDTLENEEQGVTSVREAIEQALQQSGLLSTSTPEEARRYLDALLEALTSSDEPGASTPNSEEAVAPEEEAEEEAEEQAEEEVVKAPEEDNTPSRYAGTYNWLFSRWKSPAKPDKEVTQEPTPAVERQESETRGGSAKAKETEAREAETGNEEQLSVSETLSQEPSLKDLILRLAKQVKPVAVSEHEKQQEQQTEDEVTSDALKLRKFERLLSELMVKTRETNSGASDSTHLDGVAPQTALPIGELPEDSEAKPDRDHEEAKKEKDRQEHGDVFGMILTIRNKLNGEYIQRPYNLNSKDSWTVEYAIEEIAPARTKTLYNMVISRRTKLLDRKDDGEDKGRAWNEMFQGKLEQYSMKGRAHRARETEFAKRHPVHVLGVDKPLDWESVFGEGGGAEGREYEEWKPQDGAEEKWEEGKHRKHWVSELAGQEEHTTQVGGVMTWAKKKKPAE